MYVNDVPLKEDYIAAPPEYELVPVTVPEGQLFVMGDNRNDSRDSRYIGQIPLENLVGRAEIIFFPLTRLNLFNFPR